MLLQLLRELFILLGLRIQVIEVEDVDYVLLLEQKLLHLAVDDGGHPAGLFTLLEEDDGGQLTSESRRIDEVLLANLRVTTQVDLS